ncbi:hypothetical protein CDL12_21850 [Handroanthus impetiginosus]|uniref:Uncharacterized protein n=1 Tax=Handroanthus impetiginosus TaxID=429701 RepID=A0A2G9GK70_9LAMI|nr:hypothetical protein CDL12_21850 [Handroanthus impetiginosus]
MCEEKNNSSGKFEFGVNVAGLKKPNSSKTSKSVMEFEYDWTKHRKSLPFTAQVIWFATYFRAWSCRISISEGFREFL